MQSFHTRWKLKQAYANSPLLRRLTLKHCEVQSQSALSDRQSMQWLLIGRLQLEEGSKGLHLGAGI